ncbi:MAG: hypothetical protein WC728_15990 [Elusimicrobiota bacterium]
MVVCLLASITFAEGERPRSGDGGSKAAEIDLGIPSGVPWEAPVRSQEAKRRGKTLEDQAEREFLAQRFWQRLGADLTAVERWREGLVEGLRYARGRPDVFPLAPAQGGALFDEHRAAAAAVWERTMDHWLALDSILAAYGDHSGLSGKAEARASFLAAYAAYIAEARFAKGWTDLCSNDPRLEAVFDEPVPSLGLPAGSYTRLKTRLADAESARAEYERPGRAKGLAGRLKDLRGFEKRRTEDWRSLSLAARPPKRSSGLILKPLFPVLSRAWDLPRELRAHEPEKQKFLLEPPGGAEVSVSSRVIYALDTVRHWFRLDVSTASRPQTLITARQARDLSDKLRPGDILLVRRDRFLSEIGLPGYWHHAGIFVGTADQRDRFLDESAVETALAQRAPAALLANTGREDGEAMTVLEARPGGVGFRSMGRFAAADGVAALRPRLSKRQAGEALIRAFSQAEAGSKAALSNGELVSRVYGPSLRMAPEPSSRPDFAARKFDMEFGTEAQELDLVAFLDPQEHSMRAVESSIEGFRSSSRRPKWALAQEARP